MVKDWKSCKSGKIGHSEPLWWEKIGKVANRAKLAAPSHSEPLRWGKIGKVVNRVKLTIPSHSEPLRWEKIGKVANWAKLAIRSRSEPKCQVDLRSNFFIPITDTYNLLRFALCAVRFMDSGWLSTAAASGQLC